MQKQYRNPELKRHKPVSNILYSSFSIFIFFLFITQALLPIGSMNVRSHEPDDPISMGDPVDAPLQGDYPSVFWSDFNSPDISSKYYGVDFYDINLDGNLDMIAGSLNAIHIWTSDGSGNWAPYPSPPTLDYILFQSTASGDFNHDGKPDLVSTHSEGLCAWTGDANGNWTLSNSGLEAAKVLWMYDIILDDINLDGDLDIMVSGLGRPDRPRRRAISAFIGDGDGNWQSRSNSLTKEGTHYGIDLGDFNNDGMPDMVTANTMGVDAWVNADNGSWVLTDVGLPTSSEYSDAKFADFNNDGYLDIVATSNGNGGISVWNGNGNGIWTQNSDLPDIGYYTEVEVADLNHDGYMDIIASSRSTINSIWTGGGANDWYLQSNITNGFYNGNMGIAVGDLDNDAQLEICMVDLFTGLHLYSSSVNRTITNWSSQPAPPTSAIINDIEVFDMNLDGKQDILYATGSDGAECWLGSGGAPWTQWPPYTGIGELHDIETTDFNHDGKPDLVMAGDTGLYAVSGNAAGAWQDSSGSLPSGSWLSVEIADLNHDGNIDIVGGSGEGAGIEIYDGGGSGTWSQSANLSLGDTFYDICIGDINHDGSLDIIGANGGLCVFLGDNSNGWVEDSNGLPSSPGNYISVELADIDNNGALDIIASSIDASGTNIWLNNGDGQWTQWGGALDDLSSGLAVADITIDGYIDVCTGSHDSNSGLSVFKQNEGGWLPASLGLIQEGDYKCIELADINMDGLMDIVTANSSAGGSGIWVGYMFLPDFVDPSTRNVMIEGGSNFSVLFSEADTVNVSATIDDTERGYSPISSAEYTWKFEGLPGIEMGPADGTFDHYVEEVEGTVNIKGMDAGYHNLYVYGTDLAGHQNTSSSENATLEIIDDVPPEIQIAMVEGVSTFTVLSSEAFRAKVITVVSDDTTGGSIIAGANMTIGENNWDALLPLYAFTGLNTDEEALQSVINITAWLPGVYDLYIYANDSAGNNNITSQCFVTIIIINDAAPEVSNVLLDGSSNITIPLSMVSTVDLTGTLDDWGCSDSIIGGANYTIGFTEWPTSTPMLPDDILDTPYENFTSTIDISSWDAGVYDIYMYGWDMMGYNNDTSTEHATLTIQDDLAPVVENVNIGGLAVFEVNASTATQVNIEAIINDTDYGGNLIAGANITVGQDNWPSTEMFASGALDTPIEEFWFTFMISSWEPGTYYLYVYGWDDGLNYNLGNSAYVTLIIHDDLAPVVENVNIEGMAVYEVNVSVAGSIDLKATINDTGLGDNLIAGANVTIGQDNWPSSMMLPVNALDTPVEEFGITFDISSWASGTYYLYVYGWDDLLNSNIDNSAFATLIILDDLAPVVENVNIEGLGVYEINMSAAGLVNIEATINDSAYGGTVIAGANFTIGQDNWPSIAMSPINTLDSAVEVFEYTFNISLWEPGTYYFYAYGWDDELNHDLANSAYATMVIYDDLAPMVENVNIEGMVVFEVNASTAGLIDLKATINDTAYGGDIIAGANTTIGQDNWPSSMMLPVGTLDTAVEEFVFTFDISSWAPGIYYLYAYGWDTGLNYDLDNSGYATLIIHDDMAPVISDVQINGLTSFSVGNAEATVITLTAVIDDTLHGGTNIGGANYTIGYVNWPSSPIYPTDGAFSSPMENLNTTIDISSWPPGTYELYVYGWDITPSYQATSVAHATLTIIDDLEPAIMEFLINGSDHLITDLDGTGLFTAWISDTGRGGSIISSASFTDGLLNWPSQLFMVSDTGLDTSDETFSLPLDFETYTAGIHEFFIYGSDSIGNDNLTSGVSVTVDIQDNKAPVTVDLTTMINGVDEIWLDPAITPLITLNATLSDELLGFSAINAVNYTVGLGNWSDSWMLPADGAFDNFVEDATVLIDISTWPVGTYDIYVYGTDDQGNGQQSVGTYVTIHLQGIDIGPEIIGPWADGEGPVLYTNNGTFELTAYGDESATGGSNVIAVEYFIDVVGPDGTGISMSPMDAGFDSSYEGAMELIDISGWAEGENHIFYVHFQDALGNWGDMGSVMVANQSITTFIIPVHLGWNLISIPCITPTNDILDVLDDCGGTTEWDRVLWYDTTDTVNHWKSYDTFKPLILNNLLTLDNTMGFWINISEPGDGFLEFSGVTPISTEITLYAGWNMVGFPTLANMTVAEVKAETGAICIEGYSSSAEYSQELLADSDIMIIGNGYWIYVDTDTTWVVTY